MNELSSYYFKILLFNNLMIFSECYGLEFESYYNQILLFLEKARVIDHADILSFSIRVHKRNNWLLLVILLVLQIQMTH